MSESMSVAFLGLGIMGSGMAGRLLDGGFSVCVYNRTPERARPLADRGAKVAETPAAAVRGAQLLISMLSDDAASRQIWLGNNGALAAAEPGAVLMESSTVTVGWVHELGRAASKRGLKLIDAPVSGSKLAAAGGELNFIVGGDEAAVETARPAMQAMGKSITHVGKLGSGALVKLINNFMSGVQGAALAEGIAWMEKAGVELARAMPVITNGSPGSPMVKSLAPRMTARNYEPNFYLHLLAKDLTYAIGAAAESGLDLQTAPIALKMLQDAIDAGHARQDMAAMIEPLRNG